MSKMEHYVVEGLHCPSCIREIEGMLGKNPHIKNARVNLSTQRLAVEWQENVANSDEIIASLDDIGFKAFPFQNDPALAAGDKESQKLLVSMAIAGFAAANVMLLSISDWSGDDMGDQTRLFFHWLSALIALPAAAFAGMPFYKSAYGALKGRRLNMDVPISLAVILACAMSLLQTMNGIEDTYYDTDHLAGIKHFNIDPLCLPVFQYEACFIDPVAD